jgi:hypothetical protein
MKRDEIARLLALLVRWFKNHLTPDSEIYLVEGKRMSARIFYKKIVSGTEESRRLLKVFKNIIQ